MTTQKSLEQANLSTTLPEMALYLCNEKNGWMDMGIVSEDSFILKPEDPAVRFSRTFFDAFTARNKRIFRPDAHYKRFCYGAQKLQMPEPKWELFIDGVNQLARLYASNLEDGKALYLCPEMLNISRSSWKASEQSDYAMTIKCCYTNPKRDTKYKVYIDTEHTRAHPDYSDIKASSNYGLVIPHQYIAEKNGCNSVLFTNGNINPSHRVLEELATSNIFFVWKGRLCTPKADGNMLKGITRETIMHISKDVLGSSVWEDHYDLDDFVALIKNGEITEAFMTGTAIVMGKITDFNLGSQWLKLPNVQKEESVFDKLYDTYQDIFKGKIYPEFTMFY